ncbi:hypothetical protein [Salegentibacter maritimus]|uniref:hypothetical protein n=1 Tax=Salegentibacter maritimus TaxID=2794347 RepID=UPI0018E484EC|nr:hypothetical protein [Salegentibacter maritimus]MBI6116588.1 hypothetical protein [Salegentibacter maritimus]
MDRILYGDNQFFAVNHISDAKSMAQSIKFKTDEAIINTIDAARASGLNTFMCTTHDRIANICDIIRANPGKYENFKIYPCMPYAHKYANAVTELGIQGTIKQYVPGNFFGTLFKGGMAFVSKDFLKIMELLIDAEMKMFKGINTPVIFLQNVITDLLLGLGMVEVLKGFYDYIKNKYDAEPGFITMNMPRLLTMLETAGITNPIICFSMNKLNFRMSGGKGLYEETLKIRKFRAIAMQVLGGGAIPPKEALEYVCKFPNIEAILFGASSKANIENTVATIHHFDSQKVSF